MSNYELISLIVSGFSALFIGISLIYLSKQIKLLISAHSDNHEWYRRIETQNALDKIREINIDALNETFGYANRKDPIPLDNILKEFEDNHLLQPILNKSLNFYEGLANGVFLGTYDEDSIKANRKGPMEREFVRCKYYIEYMRHQSSKSIWIAYERLINKWDEEFLKSSDRKPTGKI